MRYMGFLERSAACGARLREITPAVLEGHVTGLSGLIADVDGLGAHVSGALAISDGWLGRVIDPLGRPLDKRGPLPAGDYSRSVIGAPPSATARARLGARLDLGVRALNCFATCRQGQRLGLFAGSGVGKSSLLAMLARY